MHLEELQSCPSVSVVSGQRRPADTRGGGETRQKDGREGRHRKRLGKSGEKGLNGGKGRGEREVWSSWGWLTTPTPPSPTGSTSSTFLPLRQNHLPQPFSFFSVPASLWHRFTPFSAGRHLQSSNPWEGSGERGSSGQQAAARPLSPAPTVRLRSPAGPAANGPVSPRAQTEPVRPETGLPAPTCPRNAASVRNISEEGHGASPRGAGTKGQQRHGAARSRWRCAWPCWLDKERVPAPS